MYDLEKIGQGIRYYRIHNDLTQEKLAELAGIVPRYLNKIETGNASPGLKTVISICNALNVGINDLISSDHESGSLLFRQFKSQISSLTDVEKQFIGSLIDNIFELKD